MHSFSGILHAELRTCISEALSEVSGFFLFAEKVVTRTVLAGCCKVSFKLTMLLPLKLKHQRYFGTAVDAYDSVPVCRACLRRTIRELHVYSFEWTVWREKQKRY